MGEGWGEKYMQAVDVISHIFTARKKVRNSFAARKKVSKYT